MVVLLTLLQPLEGRLVFDDECDGWRVEQNGDTALGDPVKIPAGSYVARGRATTTRPGHGGIAREVWVFALEDGELRAVPTGDGTFSA
jgi:hypothetical protein